MSEPIEVPVVEVPTVDDVTGEVTQPADDAPIVEEAVVEEPVVEEVPEPSAGNEPPKGRYQTRIDELTRIRRDSERRANNLANEVRTLRAAAAGEKEPKEDDFPEYSDFVKAVAKYAAKQEKVSAREEVVSEEVKAAQHAWEEIQTAIVLDACERDSTFGEKATAVAKFIGPKDAAYDALFESPKFFEIVTHLAGNASVAQQIVAMNDRAQVREILRLEMELSKPKSKLPAPADRKPSKAPTPIAAPAGRGESRKELKDLSTEDYIEARRKQIIEKRTKK